MFELMRSPDAPFLEFSFYFRATAPLDAFLQVVEKVASRKSIEFLEVSGNLAADTLNMKKPYALDGHTISASVKSVAEIRNYLLSNKVVAPKVKTHGLLNLMENKYEFILLSPDSTSMGSVVSLWCDGSWLSQPPAPLSGEQKNRGKKSLSLFREFILLLNPAYAAVTLDTPLETPDRLKSDPRSIAFRDFFLSQPYLTTAISAAFADKFSTFHQEPIGEGRLFVSSGFLRGVRQDAATHTLGLEASSFVAGEIAMTG